MTKSTGKKLEIENISVNESDAVASGAELLKALSQDELTAEDFEVTDKEEVSIESDGLAEDELTQDSSSVANENQKAKLPPSILYCVPANILDISSGAALSQRTLMMSLASKGFRAVALQATIFDSAHGGEHVLKAGEQQKDKPILRAVTSGLENLMLRTKAVRRGDMTCAEQEDYLRLFRNEIHQRRPDMLFMWGGMLLEMTMMREAREAGIPVVFYLVNGGYKNRETFKYVSVVVTDTQATADLYKERLGLECKVVGKFIDPALIRAQVPRRPDFITFINPSFEKGVSLFMPLAKLAAAECPEIKFLVVQSRGRWGNALNVLKFRPEDFPNVTVIGHQTDMRPVYASTRALLLPSLWHESGARVIAEAQLNGIPILASNSGGSPELIGTGGRVLDIPEEFRENKTKLVTEEHLRPWLEEIKRLWHDQDYYHALCSNVAIEAQQHDLERNTNRFIQAVSDVVLASKGIKRPEKPSDTPAMTVQKAWELKQKRQSARSKNRGKR